MTDVTIRTATAADAGILLQLIRELAIYEKEPDKVKASEADLLRDGFGVSPRFEAIIAESSGRPAGFALYFPNYSTWEGRPGLFVEDLFVADWARRRGIGRRLLARLAAIAIERGWNRLDLMVLDWNPARDFYHRIGMEHRTTWLPYRLAGGDLQRLARAAT